jgi:hypothetical protein
VATAWDQSAASRVLRAELGIAVHVAPTTPMLLRLYSVIGSVSAAGTEDTGGSYAAQNLTTALGTEANGTVTNTGAVTYTSMPATTTVAAEIHDSTAAPGRRCAWGGLTANKTTASGDTLTFAASSITFSVNN